MLKYPDKMFAMLPHTMSTGNPYPETTNAGDFINNNEVFVKQYPLMAPFMIKSGGDFDSNALAIEMRLNLRKRITVPEFWKQFRVINGDRYFAQLELQYRLNPMNIDRTNAAGVAYLQAFMNAKSYEERFQVATSKVGMGAQLTWEAFRNLDHDARLYAQTQNSVWGSEHYGGRRRELANATYQEFKRMIKDPMFEQTVGPQDAQRYREFLDSIQAYRKAYREFRAANYSTNQLKEAWYSWCTAQAVDPANEKYAGFIYSVLRKVPDPMDDPNDMQNP
jgi:hypothetical protein